MMQQAQKMQKEMEKAQEGLKTIIVEGTAGGGSVVVKAFATKEIIDILIREETVVCLDSFKKTSWVSPTCFLRFLH